MAMESVAKRSVVIVAPASDARMVMQMLADGSASWSYVHVPPEDIPSSSASLASAAAIILAGHGEVTTPALPTNVPIIACGEFPPPNALVGDVAAWLRRPTPASFRTVLYDILGATSSLPPPASLPSPLPPISSIPPSGSGLWRRKSDMIIGRSVAIRQLLDGLDRIASSPAPVSITGESGTGKELVARALHYSSPRASQPFIALNCAAIPETLFEAELFGYVRGAFTGAVANRMGAFESAHNGTLFLDEIGEMSKTLQPKLLRVLERGELTRLGSNESRKVAVRVVTATNRTLEDEVKVGNFRQDLYYRLRVCHVHIAPLRERLEDIAPLVAHHLSIISARERRTTVPRLSATAFEKALAYPWPGNVRELVNVLEGAVLLARDNVIEAEHLQLENRATGSSKDGHPSDAPIPSYRDAKARFESEYYTKVLRAARGNISLAAKLTQKTRKEVYDAIRRAGLEVDEYRDDLADG